MKIELNMPDGKSGEWSIETFTITPEIEKSLRIRALMNYSDRFVPQGTYKRLLHGSTCVMSNTPDEIRDHYPLYRAAKGNVLINGLGLGVCIEMLKYRDAKKPKLYEPVDHITVIEASEDVIRLTGPVYENDPTVTIIHADAFEYKPGKHTRFDAVWHDVWNEICTDNWPAMGKLHRKYGKLTNWQGSWSRHMLESMIRRERREAKINEQIRRACFGPSYEEIANKLI